MRLRETAILVGQLVPTARTLISVPGGMFRMRLPRFIAFVTAGTLIWTTLLATAGYMLGENFARVQAYLNPVANVVIGLGLAIYVYPRGKLEATNQRARTLHVAGGRRLCDGTDEPRTGSW